MFLSRLTCELGWQHLKTGNSYDGAIQLFAEASRLLTGLINREQANVHEYLQTLFDITIAWAQAVRDQDQDPGAARLLFAHSRDLLQSMAGRTFRTHVRDVDSSLNNIDLNALPAAAAAAPQLNFVEQPLHGLLLHGQPLRQPLLRAIDAPLLPLPQPPVLPAPPVPPSSSTAAATRASSSSCPPPSSSTAAATRFGVALPAPPVAQPPPIVGQAAPAPLAAAVHGGLIGRVAQIREALDLEPQLTLHATLRAANALLDFADQGTLQVQVGAIEAALGPQ